MLQISSARSNEKWARLYKPKLTYKNTDSWYDTFVPIAYELLGQISSSTRSVPIIDEIANEVFYPDFQSFLYNPFWLNKY
jgi:hypothetical protein